MRLKKGTRQDNKPKVFVRADFCERACSDCAAADGYYLHQSVAYATAYVKNGVCRPRGVCAVCVSVGRGGSLPSTRCRARQNGPHTHVRVFAQVFLLPVFARAVRAQRTSIGGNRYSPG